MEDKERFRPLLNLKRDLPEFIEDVEKEDKKTDIQLKKDFSSISAVITKHRQEVDQTKHLITQ